jgi:hypothetical protein
MNIPRIPDWLRQDLEASEGADDVAIPFIFQTPGSDAPEKNTENKRQQNPKRAGEEHVTGLTTEIAANGPTAVEVSKFSTTAGSSGAQAADLPLPVVLEMLRQRAELLVR